MLTFFAFSADNWNLRGGRASVNLGNGFEPGASRALQKEGAKFSFLGIRSVYQEIYRLCSRYMLHALLENSPGFR
jgi:hypothetical protein